MTIEERYRRGAKFYDALALEWLYRPGRVEGIRLLAPGRGTTVLDLGCGTGLNFEILEEAVGEYGLIIAVDRSPEMLRGAQHRAENRGWDNIRFIEADAIKLDTGRIRALLARECRPESVDAVLSSYAMSVFGDWRAAWAGIRAMLRPEGCAAIIDMQRPTGVCRVFTPLALLVTRVGGSDIDAHPWRAIEEDGVEVRSSTRRCGHIRIVVGMIPAMPPQHRRE